MTASGHKLLGGTQCGLLVGRADMVERLRRHPLARALRVDKLTLAALEATLTGPPTPVATALATTPGQLRGRAEAICRALRDLVPVEPVEAVAAVGGGGAPEVPLPSVAVELPPELAGPLRSHDPAVVGRVERGRLLLYLVAVAPQDDAVLVAAVRRVAASASRSPAPAGAEAAPCT